MRIEEVIYEQAEALPGRASPFFITVLAIDDLRAQVTQENHVFLPGEEKYLHQITWPTFSHENVATITARAIRDTHRLFIDHLAARASQACDRWHPAPSLSCEVRRLSSHPFHRLKLENRFLHQMWEIQEWTVSRELREALAQVTRYKADSAEAELLGRIFAGNDFRTMEPGQAGN
ncbi:hypothetical protein OpiT1DRAFT_03511 [Opitutaceae bacterium TAV1]|nr:hypothetical protein OpiT1DRAFT_03511 [Opitutaceae bacterium TAV1]